MAQEAASPACVPDTMLVCMRLQKRKGSVTAAKLPTIATASQRQRSTCASEPGGKQPVYLHTPMAEVSGRFDALKHGAAQGAWTHCSGDARLAVAVARAPGPLDGCALGFLSACRRQEKCGEGELGLSSLLAGGVSINPSPPTHA